MSGYRNNLTSFKWTTEDDKKHLYKEYDCFAPLYSHGQPKEITIYQTICDHTKEYRDFYLQYIIDMLKLNASFNEDEFTFKSLKCRNKDLVVCTLVRILWEKIGCISDMDNAVFLESLRNGKSIYRNKLKRFCDFYSKIESKGTYWGTGHTPESKLVKIRTSTDFINAEKITGVNNFFYNK